jgi:hypothetical protein
MELNSLVQIFGSAGVTMFVMWMWLKSVQVEKKEALDALKEVQEARTQELKEMLPLLSETSKGLQEVIQSTSDNNMEIIKEITEHIDKKINEINLKCKKED